MASASGRGRAGKTAPAAPRKAPAAARPEAMLGMPGWVAPAVYALVTMMLFREFFLGGTSMLGSDSIELSYFARNFYTEFVQNFRRMPLWNPLLFGGLPFVEGMHGDIFYPPSLAMFFLDARVMWGWKMALHIFLAGCFTYLWLRRGLGLDRLPAFFGGLVYLVGADLVSLVLPGGDGKLFVSTLAPLMFWLTERAVARRRAADFALFSLGLALMLFTSHMQAAYYCVWGVSLYFLFRVWQLWREDRNGGRAARLIGTYALAGLLGVAAAAVQFLPPLGYLREHSVRVERAERGPAWSASYSLNAEEIVSLVVPEFVGELVPTTATRPAGGYWGKNPLKLNNEYAGLVPLLLLPVLLLRRRTPQTWFFVGLAALTLLYALAASTPLFYLFYQIPGVRLFRSWSMIIFLYGFAIATLGAMAVQQLGEWLLRDRTDEERRTVRRALWAAAGVLGVVAALAAAGAVTSIWTSLFGDSVRLDRLQANESYIRLGFWLATFVAAAVAGAWELAARNVVSARVFVVLLAFVAFADSYRVSRPFVSATAEMNRQVALDGALFRPDDVIAQLQRLRDAGRVFRAHDFGVYRVSANLLAVHGIEQISGHHGNEMGRYSDLIGGEGLENLLPSELRLLDVTNTEYVIFGPDPPVDWFERVYQDARGATIYRNRNALPRAYLAGTVEVVADDAASINRVLAADFDARNTVILSEAPPADVDVQQGAGGIVEWVSRQVDEYTLRVVPDRPALLVVLENHHPAWRATVDDREVPIWRANHAFRAIAVPPGEHTVRFEYAPAAMRNGATISLLVLALLGGIVLFGAMRDWRSQRVVA